jgi:hypothetical protein
VLVLIMRTPEQIIGADALLQLTFEGYEVVPIDRLLVDAPDEFDQFWKAYPRKAAKPDGRKAYKAARKKTKHDVIMAGVARLVAENRAPQYIPYPASWLRAEGWNDVAPTPILNGLAGARAQLRQEIENGYGSAQGDYHRPVRQLPGR